MSVASGCASPRPSMPRVGGALRWCLTIAHMISGDSAMTDEIMTQLKDSGPPQFIFAISIEAHGPYDVEPAHTAERDAIPVPEGITGRDKLELQTYLYHIKHADSELGRLVKWLAKRQRPSLVLFYGDHLPALTNSFRITGFVDGKDMLTQAGIWLLVDPHRKGKPEHEDSAQKHLDDAMASVDQLRLGGKLGKLLPTALPKPANGLAHDAAASRRPQGL